MKYLSVQHEEYIAKLFNGKRSKSSGAADHEDGDVRTETVLLECKMTGSPGKIPKPPAAWLRHFEKIAQEAWANGKEPMLAWREYRPDSVLAGPDGWIDLTIKLAMDEAEREHRCSNSIKAN